MARESWSDRSMQEASVPLIILGGGDSRPVELPPSGARQHALCGYKAVDIRLEGRPLILELIDRLQASGRFHPIFVAGPARVYEPHLKDTEVIDTDGSFGENIKASLELVRRKCPDRPVGFITSDVLPDVETLGRVMAHFAASSPSDLWFPLVRTPEDLAHDPASAWKPVYRVVPENETEPVTILGGHLVVVDPKALRRDFVYQVFQVAYATRNRPLAHRRTVALRNIMVQLIYQDLLHVAGLRLPTLTWDVVGAGVSAAGKLRRGTITQPELERAIRTLLIRKTHRRAHPERRVVLPVTDATGLAMDIDTREEAEALGGTIAGN